MVDVDASAVNVSKSVSVDVCLSNSIVVEVMVENSCSIEVVVAGEKREVSQRKRNLYQKR